MIKFDQILKSKAFMILLNFVAAGILVMIIVFAVSKWLHKYTQHGVEIVVPNITGLYTEEAEVILASKGLKLEILDSLYDKNATLSSIVEQTPLADSKVKYGRTIYAIKNSNHRRQIQMPELRNISQRQAEAKLRALGMQVGQVKYEPSAFPNIVMDLRMDSTSILAGAYVPEGSVIDLYVGRGPGAQKVKVPNVIGKTLTEARSILIGQELSVGRVEYDERPTAETWGKQVVYSQTPEEGAVLTGGGYVNLKLSIDPEKSVVSSSTETEGDEFF